jgi:hypothetical protein
VAKSDLWERCFEANRLLDPVFAGAAIPARLAAEGRNKQ